MSLDNGLLVKMGIDAKSKTFSLFCLCGIMKNNFATLLSKKNQINF